MNVMTFVPSRKAVFERMWWTAELLPGLDGNAKAEAHARALYDGTVDTAVQIAKDPKRRRRAPFVSLLVAGMLFTAGTPAKASDVPAFGQRVADMLGLSPKDFYHWSQRAGSAYKQYKMAYSLYRRIHSGNIGLNLDFTMAPIDIGFDIDNGSGTRDVSRLRINPYGTGMRNPGAFSGGKGINVNLQGLKDQVKGLISGDWDFDMSGKVLDQQGRVVKEIDYDAAYINAQSEAVGVMMLANMAASDPRATSRYFGSNGASAYMPASVLQRLASDAVKKEGEAAQQVAEVYEAIGAEQGYYPFAGIIANAMMVGALEAEDDTASGSLVGDALGPMKDSVLQGVDTTQQAYAANRLAIDMVTGTQLNADKNMKSVKNWYDNASNGSLNVMSFFIDSLLPSGTSDTTQQGEKGKEVKDTNKGDKTAAAVVADAKARIQDRLGELANKQGDLARQGAHIDRIAMARAEAANIRASMDLAISQVAKIRAPMLYPSTQVLPNGSVVEGLISPDSGVEAPPPSVGDAGEAAGAELSAKAVAMVQDALSNQDGWNEFKGVIKALTGGVAAFFGSAFINPTPFGSDLDAPPLPDLDAVNPSDRLRA